MTGPADLDALRESGYGAVFMCLTCRGRGQEPSGATPSGWTRCRSCDGAGRTVTTPDGCKPYRDQQPEGAS